jgi:dUTP pyrophosphatase
MGKARLSARRVAALGLRVSLKAGWGTSIDYAVGVSVEILLVAEPGFEPIYAQPGDAGADLKSTEDVVIPAGSWKLVGTGVKVAMPDGYVGLVHPRSGLAAKQGITVLNTPGTVDAGYRGEIKVNLYNASSEDFQVKRGDRIAQLVFQEVSRAKFIQVTELPETARGEAGFGSTGTR